MIDPIRRSENVNVRFRSHERNALEAAARRSRQTLSEFIRSVTLSAAQRRLTKGREAQL